MRASELSAFLRAATIPAAGTLSNVRELHLAFVTWSNAPTGLAAFVRALVDAGAALESVGGEVWAHDLRLSEHGLAMLLARSRDPDARPSNAGASQDTC